MTAPIAAAGMNGEARRASLRSTVLAGAVGNVMEWYDFALYGYFAPLIGALFFPAADPVARLLAAFGVFAVGYLMRPAGSVLFGYIYSGGGGCWWCRCCSWPSPARWWGCCPPTATSGSWPRAALEAWGWRLPFLLGLLSAAIALYLRLRTDETPLFDALARRGDLAANPLAALLGPQRRAALVTVGLGTFQAVGFYLPWIFLASWMQDTRAMPASMALALTTANMAWNVAMLPLAGALCDALGRRPLLIAAAAGTLVVALPAFVVMAAAPADGAALWPYAVGQGALMLLSTVYNASLLTTLVELFPTRTRATAMSVSYSLAAGVFGGTTPLVCTWLVRETGAAVAPAFYLMLAAVVALIALIGGVEETSRRPLA